MAIQVESSAEEFHPYPKFDTPKNRYQYRVFNIQEQLEQGLVGKVPKVTESNLLSLDALNFLAKDGWHAICLVSADYLLLEKEYNEF